MATFPIRDTLRRKSTEEPLRSYLWYALLPKLSNNIYKEGILYGDGVILAQSLEEVDINLNRTLSTRITNISIPFSTVETEKGIIGNSFWYYAKANDIGQISFDIYEHEDGLTLKYLEAWQGLMFNSDGTYNPPAIYKNDIKFFRLSTTKEEVIVHTYKDYFVSGIADVANDYETNDIVRYSVQLTGDKVEHEVIPVAAIFGSSYDQLKSVMSIERILPDLQSALEGELSKRTGLNIPTLF